MSLLLPSLHRDTRNRACPDRETGVGNCAKPPQGRRGTEVAARSLRGAVGRVATSLPRYQLVGCAGVGGNEEGRSLVRTHVRFCRGVRG